MSCEIPPLQILLIGDAQCGKTTLANAFAENVTLGLQLSMRSKTLMYDGTPVTLNVLDLCQEATSAELQRLWRDGAVDVFVVCFVLGDAASLTRVSECWLELMKACGATFMLVGTHADQLPRGTARDTLEFLADYFKSFGSRCFRHVSIGKASSASEVDAVFDAALRVGAFQCESRRMSKRNWCALI
jgi:GTPase SAR1 family protein